MTRAEFVDKLAAIAINSDMATHTWMMRGHATTDEEEDRIEAEARVYFDRRNNLIRELRGWFDQTFPA